MSGHSQKNDQNDHPPRGPVGRHQVGSEIRFGYWQGQLFYDVSNEPAIVDGFSPNQPHPHQPPHTTQNEARPVLSVSLTLFQGFSLAVLRVRLKFVFPLSDCKPIFPGRMEQRVPMRQWGRLCLHTLMTDTATTTPTSQISRFLPHTTTVIRIKFMPLQTPYRILLKVSLTGLELINVRHCGVLVGLRGIDATQSIQKEWQVGT